jgi:hypothetical protein
MLLLQIKTTLVLNPDWRCPLANKCKVELTSERQVEVKDKGVVTELKWESGTAVKDQLVRVIAKMTGGCAAKIEIKATSSEHNSKSSRYDLVVLRTAPPTPGADTCTKYKELICWASEVKAGELGDPTPSVKFTVKANCAACNCDDPSDTTEVIQPFDTGR